MKVVHVITGLNNGGAEAVLLRLVLADGLGSRHYIVSLSDRGTHAERFERAEVPVYALGFMRGRVTARGLIELFRLMRRIRPDVVQTWMYHGDLIGGFVARLAGIRSVAWGIRNANLNPAHISRSTRLVAKLCAVFSRWIPKAIISCSAQSTLVHAAFGYQASKFVQIPNGYDTSRFRWDFELRCAVRRDLGLTDDRFVLGMVARFDIQKDHENLIRALGLLKSNGLNFIFLLVGVGMEVSNRELAMLIKTENLDSCVKLLGPRSDIPAIMNALDVHVLSSLGEGFPNVIAEAMACGTPCVATNVGDAAVIVSDYGWVVAPQDAYALAEGINQAYAGFVHGGAPWKHRQAAGRRYIMENFGLELMCRRYRETWRMLHMGKAL